MLSAAARKTAHLDNVELRNGGLEELPVETNGLDIALCMLVLHHVSDLGRAFSEIARVLKPGGRLVVLDMTHHDREDYRTAMGHKHLGFDRDGLETLGTEAGLALSRHSLLPPHPDARGPELFTAVFRSPISDRTAQPETVPAPRTG